MFIQLYFMVTLENKHITEFYDLLETFPLFGLAFLNRKKCLKDGYPWSYFFFTFLTLKAPIATAADDTFKIYSLFFFLRKFLDNFKAYFLRKIFFLKCCLLQNYHLFGSLLTNQCQNHFYLFTESSSNEITKKKKKKINPKTIVFSPI